MPGKLKEVIETRKSVEIRAEEEGIVKAYLTKWDTIDSYNTTFARGSFAKTFKERGSKIRLLYNHEELAGKLLRSGEDDVGPWVEVQFNLDTQIGGDAFAHIRAGDIDCFSFGFNRLQSNKRPDGVVELTEVRVMEVSPVVFEANSEAKIVEVRAEDFNITLKMNELAAKGWKMLDALYQTLDDIKWSGNDNGDVLSKTDTAIADFHAVYVQWMSDYLNEFRGSAESIAELRKSSDPVKNELRNHDKDDLTKNTSLTVEDFDILKRGGLLPIESRNKLTDLPESLHKAHQFKRCKAVETLCDELRVSGFSDLQKERFKSLLNLPSCDKEKTNQNKLIDAIDRLTL